MAQAKKARNTNEADEPTGKAQDHQQGPSERVANALVTAARDCHTYRNLTRKIIMQAAEGPLRSLVVPLSGGMQSCPWLYTAEPLTYDLCH